MKKIKRILALWLVAALLALALGAVAEQIEPDAAQDVEPPAEIAQEASPEPEDARESAGEPAEEAEAEPPEEGAQATEAPQADDEDVQPAPEEPAGEAEAPREEEAQREEETAAPGFVMDGGTLAVYDGGAADVIVSDGVRSIGPAAFCNQSSLRSVTIPAGVERIGSYAFADCENLEFVALGDGLRYIEDHAFEGCANLREIALPDGLLTIGDAAFGGCAALSGVTLPASVAVIGDAAFPEAALAEDDGAPKQAEPEPAATEETGENWPVLLPAMGLVESLTIDLEEQRALGENYRELFEGDAPTFVSDNPDVVAVLDAEAGVIEGLRPGTATVTASADSGAIVTCNVTVASRATGIRITNPVDALGVKETYIFKAELEGVAEPGEGYYWESSKTSVLKVLDPATGECKGVKKGEATLTVTSPEGLTAQLTVKVLPAPSKVSLSAKKGSLGAGETLQLKATITKKTAAQIVWSSGDTDVALVDQSGLVTALQPGSAKITAKAFNGKKATYALTVKERPQGIELPDAVTLGVGQKYELKAALAPAEAASKLTIELEGAEPPAIELDKDELSAANSASVKLTALSEGEATLRFSTYNGVSASCRVKVCAPPTKVEIVNPNSVKSLGVKEEYQLTAKCDSDAGLMMHCKWKSSNSKVLGVDSATGKLTAKKAGKAKITATLPKGKKTISDSITISVVKAPSKVTVSPSAAELVVGQSLPLQLEATLPKKTSSQIVWYSEDEGVAMVDDDGWVTPVGGGTTRIVARAFNGASGSCEVTVEGLRAPELRVDGDVASSVLREVFDDVELRWSSAESVRSYGVSVTGDDGSTLLRMDATSNSQATLSKDRMRQGAIYTIRVSATMDVDGESVTLTRVARVRYTDPTADFSYEITSDGAVITGYKGKAQAVIVPRKLEGSKVTRIATGAFNGDNCAKVTSVDWPAGVIFEENSVAGLKGCADKNGFLIFGGTLCEYFGKEKKVKIPQGVLRVNDGAFDGNAKLTTVQIPRAVEEIGDRAFANCAKLKSMTNY